MKIYDPLVHPAFLDPRQWSEINLYENAFNVTREPLAGEERHTPDRQFALEHLKLELRFDDEHEMVSGTAALTFTPLNDGLLYLDLDAAELDVRRVTLVRHTRQANDATQTKELARPLLFEVHREKLSIEFPRAYTRREQLTVEIAYSCQPRKGLFFIKPDEAYPAKPRQIWSQGQNEDAHWWFPCADVTNQKMTTELLATVKADYVALSNGKLLSITENEHERTKTYHWRQEQPQPAYLVTIVIGEYEMLQEQHGELPLHYYVYADRREAGQKLFANTPRMLELFEQKFGCAFPYAKYAQVLVDDFLFGAMENTSASTFTDRCLLDECATLDLDYDDIVAHELAHHWWGDLVTCKDWTQIWLNESFATYSEYLWREHKQGRDEARFALFQDFLIYLREDAVSHRRPMVYNRYRFSEELMDRHAYEKGACVVDMLRWVLGDEAFFRSLNHYLKKFAHGVAETNDFKVAIEEATGHNLYWFFDNWLYSAGHPELEVSYEWQRENKLLKLSVEQRQEAYDDAPVFRFPVEIEIVTEEADGVIETERRTTYRVVIEQAAQDFYFLCESKPRLVVFDKGHRLFKQMQFEKSEQELSYQLLRDEDVLGRARAARELSRYKGEEAMRVLRSVLCGADHWGVRMAAAISLGEMGSESAQEALLDGYRASQQPRVRRACVLALGNFKNEAVIGFLRDVLVSDESYFTCVAAVRALANIGGERAYDILAASLTRSSWQEVIRAAVFHGFTHAKEKRAVDLALKHSRYGEPAPVRTAAISCLGALGKELRKENRDGAPHEDERLVDHLSELLKDKNVRARVAAVRALGKIGNKRALAALREAQQRECLDQLKGALLDAIESLEKQK